MYYWRIKYLNHRWRDYADGTEDSIEECREAALESLLDEQGKPKLQGYCIDIYECRWEEQYSPSAEDLKRKMDVDNASRTA